MSDAPAPAAPGRSVLLVLNAGAVLVAALYFGREILVPLTLAALLAFVLAPACAALQRLFLPRIGAVLLTVALAFTIIGGIGLVVGRQVGQLAGNLPSYQTTIMAKWEALSRDGSVVGRLASELPAAIGGGTGGADRGREPGGAAAPGLDVSGISIAGRLAQPLLGPLGTAGVVLIFSVFILLYSEDLRDRLVRLVGRRELHRTIRAMNEAGRRLSRYFIFQLLLNSSFGVLICILLWVAGLPVPVLWGILAGLMRFVPYVGLPLAALPPLLLAVAVSPGWSLALVVLAMFVVCELTMGQVVEPLIYGHSTGLSPLAVVVATAFWALLWGPVGLLIATPLTVCLVVIGRNVEALAFFDVMLGDHAPLEPAETFYQRALEGHAAALANNARRQIRDTSLSEYYDGVALPGLALAQGDLARDALAFERLEAIHTQIERFLALRLAPAADGAGQSDLPEAWSEDGAIVCVPGRGQLDDLAATMAVQVLSLAGFGARTEPNASLGTPQGTALLGRARLCCLSVLEEGSSVAAIRYLTRRLQRGAPGAFVVVCLWHAERTSPTLAALREDDRGEHLVLSAGELVAFAQACARREPASAETADAV